MKFYNVYQNNIYTILWVKTESFNLAQSLELYIDLLSATEREKLYQMRHETSSRDYLTSHALLRLGLSHFFPEFPPQAWSFLPDRYGKPQLTQRLAELPVFFNLTHTSGFVACVFSTQFQVGIDAEDLRREVTDLEIVKNHFAPEEIEALQKSPDELKQRLFYKYWTLREAYLKAVGVGLSDSRESLMFDISNPEIIAYQQGEPRKGSRFELFRFDPNYQVAVACLIPRAINSGPSGSTTNP